MNKSNTPATDVNRAAERTLRNWYNYVVVQLAVKSIKGVEQMPFGPLAVPAMKERLFDDMFANMKGAQA